MLTTPHFEIHFYQGAEAFAVRSALVFEDGYQMLSEKLKETLPWKVPVILYSSHNDFLQTNVALQILPEGVQAFAEPSRKRIVLPFTGSFKTFSHTAIHELAHVFTFQIVYNRLLDNVFSRNALFGMPLWIAEGVAEYLSVGWDAESDMFIRDAVIHDYLPDLNAAGGFMVYKAGQSAFNYIAETYGTEKVLEILDGLALTRHPDGALEKTIGLTTQELSAKWKKARRKHYWPMYGSKTEVEEIGRRLTNHIKDRAYYNTKPVMSPDGEKIAFFSDRDGLISIYIMSTIDGKVIRKLVSGHRSNRFESLHFFTSSLSWSPDGSKITFVAKSDGRDKLFIVDAKKGKVLKKIDLTADGLATPAWSPDGTRICVTGVFGGQTDLLLVDVNTETFERLTNDVDDQLHAKFFPDGKRIAFTFYPEVTIRVPTTLSADGKRTLAEMDFLAAGNVKHGVSVDIYTMNLETREVQPLIETKGDDGSPVLFDDGRKMLFTSNESGINNLYVADLEAGTYRRITDVLGGLFAPDINESKGRIVFSAFVKSGWDVYVSDDLQTLLAQKYDEQTFASRLYPSKTPESTFSDLTPGRPGIPTATLLGRVSETQDMAPEEPGAAEQDVFTIIPFDSISVGMEPLIPSQTFAEKVAESANDGKATATPVEGVQTSVSSDEPVTKGGSISNYRMRLAPDFIGQGAGLYFSTGFGFGLANTIIMSDLLGNHRMMFSFNLFRDIADSDLLAMYYYLKNRINYGVGIFQFKNFLNSRVTSVGESFQDYRLFSERNYGMFGLVSVPFTTFNRLDLELQAFVTERQFFDDFTEDPLTGQVFAVESGRSTRNLVEPSLSFVHDASFFNYFGPVDGSRWVASVSKGIGFGSEGVSRSTGFIDYRKYFRLWYRNSFAFRLVLAASEGEDPRNFFLGGPSTLRGYDYQRFEGSRIGLMTFEYRYPMIDALILGWPARWGIGNLGGSAFFDVGAAWDKGDVKPFKSDVHGLEFEDLQGDIGLGVHFYLGYFLLNFQLAWQTNLESIDHSQFHFFIGPSF